MGNFYTQIHRIMRVLATPLLFALITVAGPTDIWAQAGTPYIVKDGEEPDFEGVDLEDDNPRRNKRFKRGKGKKNIKKNVRFKKGGKKKEAGWRVAGEEDAPDTESADPVAEPTKEDFKEGGDSAETPVEGDVSNEAAADLVSKLYGGRKSLGGVPVTYMQGLWQQRRQALINKELAASNKYLATLQEAKQQSGWPNIFSWGRVLVRESRMTLKQGQSKRALELADAAAVLAPALPGTHLACSAAALAEGSYGLALKKIASFFLVSFSNPVSAARWLGTMIYGVLIALLLSAILLTLGFLRRYSRVFFHDVSHLLPRGGRGWQAKLLIASVLLIPFWAHAGPLLILLFIWVLFSPYLITRERIMTVVFALMVAALPLALPWVLAPVLYPNSASAQIYMAANDLVDSRDTDLDKLELDSGHRKLLRAMRARWTGDLVTAEAAIQAAIKNGMDNPEVFVNRGNLRYWLGDSKGALLSYEEATVRNPKVAEADFNSSRVFFHLADHNEATAAYERAGNTDYEATREWTILSKERGSLFVAETRVLSDFGGYAFSQTVPTDTPALQALYNLLAEPVPMRHGALVGFIVAVLLALSQLLHTRLKLSVACHRCERPACKRCTPDLGAGAQCAQCENIHGAKGRVSTEERIRKEREIRRINRIREGDRHISSLFLPGFAQNLKGHPDSGALLTFFFVFALVLALVTSGWIAGPLALPLFQTTPIFVVALGIMFISYSLAFIAARKKGH